MTPRWLLALQAVVLSLAACGLPPPEEQPPPRELPVVDDEGPFDPREAVDDDDEEGAAALRFNKREIDRDPFEGTEPPEESVRGEDDGQGAASEPSRRPTGEAQSTEHDDSEKEPAAGAADDPDFSETEEGERVASPEEVDRLSASRQARMEEIDENSSDDDADKVSLASNPPAEDPGVGESMQWTLTDVALEGLLVGIAALVVAAAWTFIHFTSKLAALLLLVLVCLGLFLSTQFG